MQKLPIFLLAISLASCGQAPSPGSGGEGKAALATKEKNQGPDKSATAPSEKTAPPKGKEPKPDKKLSSSEEDAYRNALQKGRKLHHAKKYAEAVKAFAEALAVYPDDPRALSEQGWAAFFANDLKLAEECTRLALSRTSDATLRGSTLYNLGRIQEGLGQTEEAILSYQQSLKARPNQIVRERLARLDSAAAASTLILGPHALKGPFADLEEFCKEEKKESGDETLFSCDPSSGDLGDYQGPKDVAKLAPPYQGLRLIAASQKLFADAPVGLGELSFFLAVKTKEGWFVSQEAALVYNPGAFGIFQSLEGKALEIGDLIPGGPPEILFHFVYAQSDHNMAGAERYYSSTESKMICGVGPSGRPSCTNPIPEKSVGGLDYSLWDEAELGPPPEKSSEGEWGLTVQFLPDGQLELSQSVLRGNIKDIPKEVKGLLGKHSLAFP